MYGTSELSGDSGVVVSPLFPHAFFLTDGHPNPSWRINVQAGSIVQVSFELFEVEVNGFGNHDCLSSLVVSVEKLRIISPTKTRYLKVYDGFDDTAPELMRKCGSTLPSSVMSSGNGVFIRLFVGSFEAHVSMPHSCLV